MIYVNTYILKSEESNITQQFAGLLGSVVTAGDVICLDGDLGAGKTTFTQGFARGLLVSKEYYVSSPSFAIMHEYPGRIPLYHFDFYRLGSSEEIIDLGLEDFFYGNGVSVIEWSQKGIDNIPEDCLEIQIEIRGETSRTLTCRWKSEAWTEKIKRIIDQIKQ